MRRPRRSTRAEAGARKRKPAPAGARAPTTDDDAIDLDAPEHAGIDWEDLPRHTLELDPALVERIHARRRLRQLTLRVGDEQIAEARRVAEQTGTKYQAVLRRWLAEGASRARAERIAKKRGAA